MRIFCAGCLASGFIAALLAGPWVAPVRADEAKGKKMVPMNPSSCPAGQLLPSVAELNPNPRQRIPYPTSGHDELGVYGRLTNGQRIARHLSPSVYEGLTSFTGALLRKGQLDPGLREMIIVRVGYSAASAYEVYQHRSLAVHLGVPDATLDALACTDPQGLNKRERVVIAFVDELITKNRPSDAALDQLRGLYNDSQVMEIVAVTGVWWTLARMLETTGVPLDERTIGEQGVVDNVVSSGADNPQTTR